MSKSQTSANVGFAIPDDDTVNARYYRGAEVYVKSFGEVGVVKAISTRGRKFVYKVDTPTGSTICTAGDLVWAGKAAAKAMAEKRSDLDALCAAATLTADDVRGCIRALATSAKAVGIEDRDAAIQTMRCLKAAFAVLAADPQAVDVAKAFVKKAAEAAPTGEDVIEMVESGDNEFNDPPATSPDPDGRSVMAGTGVVKHVKALVARVQRAKATGTMSDDEEGDLLAEAETLRAYATGANADQMAALAHVEQALYEPRDPGIAAWADKVLAQIDEYQKHIGAVAT